MIGEWLILAACVLLTIGTGVFVAAEFSLITLDRVSVENKAKAGDRSAKGIMHGLRTLSTQLSGAQVGITLTTLLVGLLIGRSLEPLLAPGLHAMGLSEGATARILPTLSLIIATVFSMILGELVPKNLAIATPYATARWAVPLQRAFTWSMGPLIKMLNGSANRFLRMVNLEPQEELSAGRSPEELAALVQRSAQQGTLDEGTAELLTKSLGFAQLTADDVMTPRVQVSSLPRTATAADVQALARATGISRFPVIDGDSDDVLGIVHLKSVVKVPYAERGATTVVDLMGEVQRVPETLRLPPLLAELRSSGSQVAVVQDEYGGTAGIVTLEDVIEELVGEVDDEHDRSQLGIRKLPSGVFLLPGMTRPDQLNDLAGIEIPDSPVYETLAGFIVTELGRLPEVGDTVPLANGTLAVLRIDDRRIDRVRFTPSVPSRTTRSASTEGGQ